MLTINALMWFFQNNCFHRISIYNFEQLPFFKSKFARLSLFEQILF